MEELTAPEDMTPDGIRRALDVAGLGHLWARIEPELLPALAITTVAANDEELPPGSSKFGGLPDLPEGEDWPLTEYRIPFAFLAQFDLAEVHHLLPTDDTLPTSGLLSFFYFNDYYYTFHPRQFGRLTEAGSWEPLPDGFWEEQGGGTAVGASIPFIRYTPANVPLVRVAPPTVLMDTHSSARLALRPITTPPGFTHQAGIIIDADGTGEEDFERYVRDVNLLQSTR